MSQTILTAVLTLLYIMITAQPDVWLGSVGWKIQNFQLPVLGSFNIWEETERDLIL